ncbi:hypothetical protein ACO0K0_18645 [Undibacterium sp. SXout11W]|uniref:hypothetical protein n=1 Tax=Undibacterium sp. SXout11W TaxID=3413050 RepID=UPI003BF1668B
MNKFVLRHRRFGQGMTEYLSLFNPYWRASLATDGRVVRGIADAAKGIPPIASLLGGDSTCI